MRISRPATAVLIISAAVGLLAQNAQRKPGAVPAPTAARTMDRSHPRLNAGNDIRKLKKALAERDLAKLEGIPSSDRDVSLLLAKIAAAERPGLHAEAEVPRELDADALAAHALPKYPWDDVADVGR